MGKYVVTLELSETIRDIRLKKNIASKAVADHLNKSQSYMTKLEKGEIKSIEENDLTSIFRFLLGNDENFDKVLEELLSTLHLRYTDAQIEEQLWFLNYDTVERQIPIPNVLVDDLNLRMDELALTLDTLCERINSNEGISLDSANIDSYEINKWQVNVVDDGTKNAVIRMQVDTNIIQKILNKNSPSSNYITIFSIAYYLKKIETYGNTREIDDAQNKALFDQATDYLNIHKFFSISEKRKLTAHAETSEEKNNILSPFDKENRVRIRSIVGAFGVYSEYNLLKANKTLSTFERNLEWDMGFMMTLLKIPLYSMENMNFATKKSMLEEIREVVKKYQNLPKEDVQLETYD